MNRFLLRKSFGAKAAEKVHAAIYPNKCLFCKKVLGNFADVTCEACGKANEEVTGLAPLGISAVFAACAYEGEARGVVHRFKFEGKRMLARPMAGLIFQRIGKTGGDMLLPVPLHVEREKSRGYNQAALLAQELSLLTGVTAYNGMERVKNTAQQFELSPEERYANVAEAFALREGFCVKGSDVLLVDDVLTTGATVAACVEILMKGGAKSVGLVVFAAVV